MTIALILLFGCYTVLAWRDRVLALGVLLFFLPAYQLRFTFLGIPFTVLEGMILVCTIVWAVRRWVRGVGRPLAQLPWRWTMLLLALCGVVSVFVAPDRISALGFWKAYLFEPMLIFVVLWDVVRTERQVRWLLAAVAAASVVLTAIAIEQSLGFLPSPEPWLSEVPKRVTSLFAYPNALGLFLAPVVALFTAFALLPSRQDRGLARFFPWAVAAFGVLGLALVVSRGGMVAVAAVIAVLGLVSPYRRWVFGILGMILALTLLFPPTRAIVVNVVRGTDVSTDVRYVLWQGTARLLLDRPIVGAGLGGFPVLYDQYRLAQHTELLLYPHNIILNAWVELGLAGMLLFVWLMVDAIRRGFRLLKNRLSPFGHQLVYAALAALLVIIVHGVVDVPYWKNDLAVQFWFVLSLIPIAGRFGVAGQK
ncbi:MAG: O-antigen ligase family protein [Candidatus Kerfeldbacteria bacterium]|nr:O-antigen ligase family protein [Candidatus Kerfeldbacteria bacterium]